jgi:hypothetical protein
MILGRHNIRIAEYTTPAVTSRLAPDAPHCTLTVHSPHGEEADGRHGFESIFDAGTCNEDASGAAQREAATKKITDVRKNENRRLACGDQSPTAICALARISI